MLAFTGPSLQTRVHRGVCSRMQARKPFLASSRLPDQSRTGSPHESERDTADDIARLLVASAQGSAEAFKRLYDLQAPRLYAVALRITRQPALAADAVHDAMLQVWRNA